MAKLTIAITGSNGFLGKNLVQYFKSLNFNIIEISTKNGFNLIDWESIKNIPKFDFLIHLAGKTFVPNSYNNSLNFYHFNLVSTINALELVKLYNATIIFPSSYLYGQNTDLIKDETINVTPHNPYSQTKYLSEEIIKGYVKDFHLNAIILRLANVYGPYQGANFLIPEIIEKIKTNNLILNDERPKRDYIFITDVCRAIELLLNSNLNSHCDIYNLGYGKSWSVKEISEIIARIMNKNISFKFKNEFREKEILDSLTSCIKIFKKLNWQPEISLEEGLTKTIPYYL